MSSRVLLQDDQNAILHSHMRVYLLFSFHPWLPRACWRLLPAADARDVRDNRDGAGLPRQAAGGRGRPHQSLQPVGKVRRPVAESIVSLLRRRGRRRGRSRAPAAGDKWHHPVWREITLDGASVFELRVEAEFRGSKRGFWDSLEVEFWVSGERADHLSLRFEFRFDNFSVCVWGLRFSLVVFTWWKKKITIP